MMLTSYVLCFFVEGTSTRTPNAPFQDSRVLGEIIMSFCLLLNSSSSAFTLANSLTHCCSMKSSSMMLTSCVLCLFQGTSRRTTNAPFQNSRVLGIVIAHRHALQMLRFKLPVSWES